MSLLPEPSSETFLDFDVDPSLAPSWFQNDHIRTRVLSIYEMYCEHSTIQEMAAEFDVSPTTVWADIKRARQLQIVSYGNNIEQLMAERVEHHRALLRRCRIALDALHIGYISPNAARRILRNEEQIVVPEYEMTANLEWTPRHAEAEAKILDVMQRSEANIDKIFGLGVPNSGVSINIGTQPQLPVETNNETIIIDVQQVMNEGGKHGSS